MNDTLTVTQNAPIEPAKRAATRPRRRRDVFSDARLLAYADEARQQGDAGKLVGIVEHLIAERAQARGEDVIAGRGLSPLWYDTPGWAARLRAVWAQELKTRRLVADLDHIPGSLRASA